MWQAIAAWNARAPDPALAAARARIAELVDEVAALLRQVDAYYQDNAHLREAWDAQIHKTIESDRRIAELEAENAAMRSVYEVACRYQQLRRRIAAGEPIQGLARRTRDARIDLLGIAATLTGEGEDG